MVNGFEENKRALFVSRFGKLLEIAKEKKISMDKLAEELKVTKPTLYRWKRGDALPNDGSITLICDYFGISPEYFNPYLTNGDELTKTDDPDFETDIREFTDPNYHKWFDANCSELSKKIGLKKSFVSFIRENPAIAAQIIDSDYIDGFQSGKKEVPVSGSVFQMQLPDGVKLYPSDSMIVMMRLIQRDIEEYMPFLVSKYSKVFEEYRQAKEREQVKYTVEKHKAEVREIVENKEKREIKTEPVTVVGAGRRGCLYEYVEETGAELPKRPEQQLYDMLRDRNALSNDENLIIDLFRDTTEQGKDKIYKSVCDIFRANPTEERKKIKAAVRHAMETNTPVPPKEEILKP